MKILTIKHTERMGMPNYSFLELEANAEIQEGDDALSSMLTLKTLVNTALLGKASETVSVKATPEVMKEVIEEEKTEEITAEAVKEKKTRVKKEKTEKVTAKEVTTEETVLTPGQEIPPVIPAEEVKEEVAVKYDRGQESHKSMLSAYLTKTFADWKVKQPKQKIIDFNSTLHGVNFLDSDGLILESFKTKLASFYA